MFVLKFITKFEMLSKFLSEKSFILKSTNHKPLFNPRMTILGGHNCVPGERLGSIDEFEGGRGTYIRKGFIYSSRIGKIRFLPVILKV